MGVGVPEGLFLGPEFMDDALRDFLTPVDSGGKRKGGKRVDINDVVEPTDPTLASGGLIEVSDFEVPG